jgi:hypothetical protein
MELRKIEPVDAGAYCHSDGIAVGTLLRSGKIAVQSA